MVVVLDIYHAGLFIFAAKWDVDVLWFVSGVVSYDVNKAFYLMSFAHVNPIFFVL